MNKEQFIDDLKEALELDGRDIRMEDEFRRYEEWDSLTFLSLLTMLRQDYGLSLDIDTFNSIRTWGELYDKLPS